MVRPSRRASSAGRPGGRQQRVAPAGQGCRRRVHRGAQSGPQPGPGQRDQQGHRGGAQSGPRRGPAGARPGTRADRPRSARRASAPPGAPPTATTVAPRPTAFSAAVSVSSVSPEDDTARTSVSAPTKAGTRGPLPDPEGHRRSGALRAAAAAQAAAPGAQAERSDGTEGATTSTGRSDPTERVAQPSASAPDSCSGRAAAASHIPSVSRGARSLTQTPDPWPAPCRSRPWPSGARARPRRRRPPRRRNSTGTPSTTA